MKHNINRRAQVMYEFYSSLTHAVIDKIKSVGAVNDRLVCDQPAGDGAFSGVVLQVSVVELSTQEKKTFL